MMTLIQIKNRLKQAPVLLVFLFMAKVFPGLCQQRMQFTQYMVNQYALNPAAGGIDADLDVTVSYRKQWVSFGGGPATYYLSSHMPIKVRKKPGKRNMPQPFHSAGMFLYRDVTGPISKTSALASYSYNLPLFKDYRLALGIFAGMMQLNLDYSQLKFDQDGEVLSYRNKMMPDASTGLWFYNSRIYFGTSVNQLFSNSVKFLNTDGYMAYHYYITSGYKIPLGYETRKRGHYNFYLVPSFMLKYGGRGTSPSVDMNIKFHYRDLFWVGSSYRHKDALAFLTGIRFTTQTAGLFEVAYSYDYTLSKINSYTTGSHEIILRYNLKMKPSIVCPEKFW